MIVKNISVKFFCLLIRIYQITLSPYFGTNCRFSPTCSQYTMEAIQKFGIFQGIFLGIKRISRCQPYCQGGYDPVPSHLHMNRNDKNGTCQKS